ncbi:SH2B2 isoform 2 [Pongo abelii]|uniref:SH2B adaptor protein 2 n=2 Tax=Hominidae TaxID=9604 RepID=A0A087X016_HUMAN|nr:SH2B2 isoform 2 [Pongo abelii]
MDPSYCPAHGFPSQDPLWPLSSQQWSSAHYSEPGLQAQGQHPTVSHH